MAFQEVIEAQEKTITSLLKAVREQHDQLDNQKIKIQNLEEKVKQDNEIHFLFEVQIISKFILAMKLWKVCI